MCPFVYVGIAEFNFNAIAELSGAELTEDRLVEQCYREERSTA